MLPQYRGAAPIQHAILNNESQTGISIIELDKSRFDYGKILSQRTVDIPRGIMYADLVKVLGRIGGVELVNVVADLSGFQVTIFLMILLLSVCVEASEGTRHIG